ncbi:FAD-binding protein [Streptomyces sp. NPDC088785]|uniref:FAD-dependent oxidoreductase n=1 Tax=Streptomyces sp. NPDC088785 TaxID=3365897 RepID=UPI00381B4F1D
MRVPKERGEGPGRRGLLAASLGTGAAAVLAPGRAAAAPGPAADRAAGAPPAEVVVPDDPRYGEVVSGWNQRWTATPDAVHLVGTAAQARAAVQRAVRRGQRLSVRSGGHCYEDFVFHPDARLVVDLSRMNGVSYDPAHRAFGVQPGARLLDVYEELYLRWGVTVPAGICFSVGAGGHVCGGGWGMLCRRDGLVVDHLFGVEAVVVDASGTARLVTATREDEGPLRDLWWAHTGGGGGNFGLVTRYLFRSPGAAGEPSDLLPAPPREVLLCALSWSWEDLDRADVTRLLDNWARFQVAHRDPGGPYDSLCSYLVLGHRSTGTVSLTVQSDATEPDAEARLDAFLRELTRGVRARTGAADRAVGKHPALPGLHTARRMPWMRATRLLGTTNALVNDPSLYGDFKSAYLRRPFTAAQADTLYDQFSGTDVGTATASLTLSSYGGRVNAVPRDATASVHRDSAFKALWGVFWDSPAQEAASLSWIRAAYGDVFAATGGVPAPTDAADGAYVNYPDADLGDSRWNTSSVPWHDLYYGENYPRLQRVKGHWDPTDVFHHRQSVRLPGR